MYMEPYNDDNSYVSTDVARNTELSVNTVQNEHEKLFNDIKLNANSGNRRPRIKSDNFIAVYCPNCNVTTRKSRGASNCEVCGTAFLYECVACSKRYISAKSAHTHLHHERERLACKCPYCDHQATRMYNLRQHIMYKHTQLRPDDYHECPDCGARLKSREILARHRLRVCGNKRPVNCQHCGFSTKYSHYLKKHMLKQHPSLASAEWRVCKDCGNILSTLENYRKHLETKCGQSKTRKEFDCAHCEVKCMRKNEFIEHLQQMHADVVGDLEFHFMDDIL